MTMTQEQIELVQSTSDVLISVGDRIADSFYDRLFEIAPETRRLFPEDMRRLKVKLVETLSVLVNHIGHRELLAGHLDRLGRHHAILGITADQYAPVGEALLHGLNEALGDRFDGRAREAWSSLYAEVSAAMTGAAARRTPPFAE